MKVLFIGGTGIISSACAALAVARGYELYLLNRGASWRVPPAAARLLRTDIRDKAAVSRALARDPAARFLDCRAFAEALRPFAG